MIQRLWLPRVAACAALLAGLCISGDDVWRIAAQQGMSPDALAGQRAIYDDPVVFEQLSAGARLRLERLFGRKDTVKEADTPAPEGGRLPDAPALDSPALLANPLVNNTALDTTAQDTQSGTTIALASGSNVIVAFNNSRFYATGNPHFTGWSTSSNGGTTWTDRGSLPVNASNDGDVGYPTLAYDSSSGVAYLTTLSFNTTNRLEFFRSVDNGVTWSAPINPALGFSTSFNLDKPWMAVDTSAGMGQGYVYVVYKAFGSPSGIYLSRSIDTGFTFGTPVLVTSVATGQGAWVVVGPDHTVHVFWYETAAIKVRRSIDRGLTFSPEVTVATLLTTGTNGDLGLNGGFRSNAFPQAVVNRANGHLYAIYNDNPAGNDKANIYSRVSSDGGLTWSPAVTLNDDVTENDQFFPTIAVTPDGSRAFASWYDRRTDPANSRIERWGVIGTVSGGSIVWGSNFPISTSSFPAVRGQDPALNSTFMGDYDQAVADNNSFYVPWGDNRLATSIHANQPDVRFARIPVTGPGVILTYGSSSLAKLDPHACNSLYVTVKNVGSAAATGVSAVLGTSAPGVVIEQAAANYPAIPANGGIATNTTPFRVRFASGFVCGTNIPLTLTVSTGGDVFALPFTLGSSFSPNPAVQFDNNSPTPIPDVSAIESPVTVSALTGAIAKVTVSFHATHTFDSDLDVTLIGPDNTAVELSTDNGGGGDNYGSGCTPQTNRTTFDDAAAVPVISGAVPFVGTFRPEGSLAAFNGKSGSALNGVWKLRIADDAGADVGTLNCWSLFITTGSCTVGGSCSTETRRISDVDGDRRSDVTVFRPSTGTWFSLQSTGNYSTFVATSWGISSDIPVPGDYDGDAKTDFAVYRPSAGIWFIKQSSTGYTTSSAYNWGTSTDVPVPGDYDGDGKTDIVVFRPSIGAWFILKSSSSFAAFSVHYWGQSSDIPVPADYDGDGKVDLAIYRPSNGVWFIALSSTNYATSTAYVWGVASDVVLPGDYDGDGRADIAVYRPSAGAWYIRWSSTNFSSFGLYIWGGATDTPVPADYDGDGRLDIAFYRPSSGSWYVLPSTSSYTAYFVLTWGAPGDVPVVYRP
jgi:subtilisin-like proprotein convertase family protein